MILRHSMGMNECCNVMIASDLHLNTQHTLITCSYSCKNHTNMRNGGLFNLMIWGENNYNKYYKLKPDVQYYCEF